MEFLLTIFYVIICLMLIVVILLQRGKEVAGGVFGSGSTAVLSSQGTTSFLTKTTGILGALFFGISLFLGIVVNQNVNKIKLQDLVNQPAAAVDQLDQPAGEQMKPKATLKQAANLSKKAASVTGQKKSAPTSVQVKHKPVNKQPIESVQK